MFGSKQSTTSTNLFGSTPSNNASNAGSSLFGTAKPATSSLFGSNQPSTNTGGSLFGTQQPSSTSSLFGSNQPATSQAAQPSSTSLFGSNQPSTTSSSLFGSNQPSTTTSNLFGSTTTNNATGSSLFGPKPSLFGSTQPLTQTNTGGSLFGTAQPAANQQNASQIDLIKVIDEAIGIKVSLTEPKLYGDESDTTVRRLNQLSAACGVGEGYYDKDKKPAAYDPTNPYFQFRAIGYCALSRHKDSDGIVALILNQSAESFSTPQERQKFTDLLRQGLGGDINVRVHIVNVRPLTEVLCEVEIYVTKVGIGRINAKDLFAYLNHPDRTKFRDDNKLQKIVPRVEMNEEDVKRYLSNPPKGFSEREWRQAITENPDSQNLLPYPIYGYKELDDRRQRQLKERDVQRKSLGQLNDRLKAATQDIQQIDGLKKVFQEDAKRLRHRILRIIAASYNKSHQTAVTVEEENLLSRLETIAVCINAPNRLHHRIEKLHEYLRANKESLENRKKEAADHQSLSEEESAALKRYLKRRQQDLDLISDSLANDAEDAKIMLKEKF